MIRASRWTQIRRSPAIIAIAALAATAAIAALAAVTAAPPNLSKALEAQRKLVAERPADASAHNDLGNLLQLAAQPKEAEEAYRRAIELDPQKVSALFNLGVLLQKRGEPREALKLYQRVVEVEPGHAWAHYQLGAIYESRGDESHALRSYAQAFALDPQLTFAEVNPHVVDNKLLMKAVLLAYRSEDARPQAPPIYEDAARIRDDLIGLLPAAAKAAEPAAEGESPAALSAPAAGSPAPPPGRAAAEQPKVLRPSDLDRSKVTGQAGPAGRFPSTARPPAQPNPALRQWARPEPTGEEVSTEEVPSEEPQFMPPPAGVYYRPGVQSTGRLNLEVGPARSAGGRRTERG